MVTVNLIPQSRLDAKRRRRNVRRWAVVCTAYAMVLVVLSVLFQTSWSHVDRSHTRQLDEVTQHITSSEASVATLGPQLAQVKLSLAIEREIFSQPDWSILLAMLGNIMGEEIVLRECELHPMVPEGQPRPVGINLVTDADGSIKLGSQQYQLKLHGLGQSQSAVSRYVLRLEEMGLFEQVKLINTMREPVRDGIDAFAFRIECVLGAARPAPATAAVKVTP